MNKNTSNRALLQYGIDWLNLHQERIIKAGIEAMKLAPSHISKLQEPQLYWICSNTFARLISRLEGTPLDFAEVQQNLLEGIKQGATLPEMTANSDRFHNVVIAKAQEGLVHEPEIVIILVDKINYFSQLIKSSMASAFITYHFQTKS